jgi:hypothetical protein
MVWGGFKAIIKLSHLTTIADAGKDTSPDATLNVNGKKKGGRLEAKRRGGRPEYQGKILFP